MNLVVNARDAMPQGGKLTIETANVELDEHYARLHPDVPAGTYVMLAVSDTGVGWPRRSGPASSSPSTPPRTSGKGTGLGLATVYGIVKQSSGAISVYSEPGLGTTFKIYLPRVLESADTVAAPAPGGVRGGSETILLAEDNEMVRTLTCEILKRQGYTVVEARHGADALDIARRYHGRSTCSLTDVVMPEMSGPELAGRLGPIRPQMKIIYMSGYTADAIDHQGMLDEGIEFLPKPVGRRHSGAEGARGAGRAQYPAPLGSRPLTRGRRLLSHRRPGHGLGPGNAAMVSRAPGAQEVPDDLDRRPVRLRVHPRGRRSSDRRRAGGR